MHSFARRTIWNMLINHAATETVRRWIHPLWHTASDIDRYQMWALWERSPRTGDRAIVRDIAQIVSPASFPPIVSVVNTWLSSPHESDQIDAVMVLAAWCTNRDGAVRQRSLTELCAIVYGSNRDPSRTIRLTAIRALAETLPTLVAELPIIWIHLRQIIACSTLTKPEITLVYDILNRFPLHCMTTGIHLTLTTMVQRGVPDRWEKSLHGITTLSPYLVDPTMVAAMVDTMWNTIRTHLRHESTCSAVMTFIRTGMYHTLIGRSLLTHIRHEIDRSPDTPDDLIIPRLIYAVATGSWHPDIVSDIISLIDRLWRVPWRNTILPTIIQMTGRSWGYGHDHKVLAIIESVVHDPSLSVRDIVSLIRSGLSSPVADRVIGILEDHVRPVMPDAEIVLLLDTHRTPWHHAIAPVVIHALHEHPWLIMSHPDLIRCLWDIDPVTTMHTILSWAVHGLTTIAQPWAYTTVVHALGHGWGYIDDRILADTLWEILHRWTTNTNQYTTLPIHTGIQIIIDGIRRTPSPIHIDLLFRMVQSPTPEIRRIVAAALYSLWESVYRSWIPSLLSTLRHSADPDPDLDLVIIDTLRAGWGHGYDRDIAMLLHHIHDHAVMHDDNPRSVDVRVRVLHACCGAWIRSHDPDIRSILDTILFSPTSIEKISPDIIGAWCATVLAGGTIIGMETAITLVESVIATIPSDSSTPPSIVVLTTIADRIRSESASMLPDDPTS
jgi:hypothetical protein